MGNIESFPKMSIGNSDNDYIEIMGLGVRISTTGVVKVEGDPFFE